MSVCVSGFHDKIRMENRLKVQSGVKMTEFSKITDYLSSSIASELPVQKFKKS